MAKANVSKDEYLSVVRIEAALIQKQGERLSAIARFLGSSHDFSPETIRLVGVAMSEMKATLDGCKKVKDISVSRGLTHFDEEKARMSADIEAKKAELSEGTLRINRRVSDMAAE